MIDSPSREQPMVEEVRLETWRCAGCGRIVAKYADLKGTIQIKCKCNAMNALTIK